VAALGFLLLGLPGIGGAYWGTFFPGILMLGLGMAASIAPLTTVVMNAVGEANAGIASGVNNAVSRAAGVLSIALLGILIANVFGVELERRVSVLPLDAGARRQVLEERARLVSVEPPPGLSEEQAAAIQAAVATSFVAGFRAVCRASAVLALGAALSTWLWIGRRSPGASSAAEASAWAGSPGSK
jgi:hypothetical protein